MKHLKFFFIFAVLLTIGTTAYGQNVTIKASNGSMIASTPTGSSDYDTFFKCGGFATWQHGQLSMVLTASDETTLSDFGQLKNPANNLFSDGTHIQIGKGQNSPWNICYLSLTLPKGYRFTSYTIKFSKPNELTKSLNNNSTTFNSSNSTSTFGETNSSFVFTNSKEAARGGSAQTITRTSMTDDDMDNTLYFRLEGPSNGYAMITLESAEFVFTAEADHTPLTTPGEVQRVSAIDIPFLTSKVDYGSITSRNYNGVNRISYSSANVKDLAANLTLFEAGSVTSGTNYDGISGNVVDYKKGSISVENGYYRIGAEDAKNPGTKEHIYYLETPTYVLLSDKVTKNPVGYRIVGATIDYIYGETKEYGDLHETYETFYISYIRQNTSDTYYMNSTAGTTTNTSQRASWFIDEDGYIRTGANGTTYLSNLGTVNSGTRYASVTQNKDQAVKCTIDDNGYIYYTENGNNYYLIQARANRVQYFRFVQGQGTTNGAQIHLTGSTSTIDITDDVIGTTTQPYTLKVYGKDGTMEGGQEVTVNAQNASGSVTLGGLNNDAIKIGVIGTGLIQGSLIIQALDPYIDHMEIVCEEAQLNTTTNLYEPTGNGRKLTIPFSASDFAVSGGAFHFYIPTSFQMPCLFSFKELYSKYGDNTYYGETGSTNHARYSFVKSPYWDSSTNLYASNPDANYQTKVSTNLKGTIQYHFNNADTVGTQGGQYREYPFTLARYTAAGGNFDQLYYTNAEMTSGASKTAYLFTCDETRYNISTATATQHRTYAFYQLDITAQRKDYDPKLAWEKIYNQTYYNDGGVREDAMYGLTVTTTQAGEGNSVYGYVTVAQINQAITDALGKTDAPATKDQILYIDGSDLLSVVEVAENNVTYNYAKLKDGLAKNALVYLPKGTSTKIDNYAVFSNKVNNKKSFAGANNFIIYDKNPFYSKYDVQVDAANSTTYERLVTNGKNGKVTAASIILPFEIKVDDNGIHTNVDGTQAFSLHQLQTTDCLSDEVPADVVGGDNDVTYAFFPKVSNITKSEPNKPYVVKVLNPTDGNTSSFIVTQKGALIAATTGMASDYTITGGTASGKSKRGENNTQGVEKDYNFTSKGTYAGITINKGAGVFYFAQNKFVCSNDLDAAHPTVKGQPFRAFYTTGSTTNLLPSFEIYFGEGNGTPTGITDVTNRIDTGIKGGKGTITISSAIDNNVKIYNTSGMHFMDVNMQAGETKTVNIPAGIYVVNGVKIIVK